MKSVQVVAALITNSRGEVLLAQRPRGKADEGLWEFPGGKIESDESPQQSLIRELQEELDIEAEVAGLCGKSTYLDAAKQLAIELSLHHVEHYQGTPIGMDGQALRWVHPARMHRLLMPPADKPLARDIGLPRHYAITPEIVDGKAWLQQLERVLQAGLRLVLLRCKSQAIQDLRTIAVQARDLVAHYGGEILLQDDIELAQRWRFGGVSLTAKKLMRTKRRDLPAQFYMAASCHSAAEFAHAKSIGCDFVTLAPVLPTPTHPSASTLGWPALSALCASDVDLPIFALGGMQPSDLNQAREAGAWGIAGISGYFTTSDN